MKKLLLILIFLFSITNAIECFDGSQYVKIPSQILPQIGYKEYSITHSNFDCKMAYKRYLKIKEIEPVNVSYVTKNENKKLEKPRKIGSFLPIFLLVIAGIIWLIKNVVQEEPRDEYYTVIQKEPVKSCDNSSNEYSNNLIKLEEERQKKEQAYFDVLLGKNCPIKIDEQDDFQIPYNESTAIKEYKKAIEKQEIKGKFDDLADEYSRKLREIEKERQQSGFYKPVMPQAPYKFKSDYDFLLHSPEWLDCRKMVFAAQGQYCAKCHSTKKLQVHHKFYLAYPNGKKVKPWEYPMEAFKVLCTDCHIREHQTHKIKFYKISYNSNPKKFKCIQ